ncbi:MAG: tetratricopeptide repeat protein, partial [Puniceicoccales bacterium]
NDEGATRTILCGERDESRSTGPLELLVCSKKVSFVGSLDEVVPAHFGNRCKPSIEGWGGGESRGGAVIPYRVFYEFANLDPGENYPIEYQSVSFRVSSQLEGVRPEDIELYIDSDAGRVPLEVRSDGIFDVPISQALFAENPGVVSNQPKESLNVQLSKGMGGRASFELGPEGEARVRYLTLFPLDRIRQQMNSVASNVSSGQGFSDESWEEWCMVFENTARAETARMTVEFEGVENLLPKDDEGRFILGMKPQWFETNPWVRFDPRDGWSGQLVNPGSGAEDDTVPVGENASAADGSDSPEVLSKAEGLERIQELLQTHPENFGVRAQYAFLLMEKGEFEEALVEFEEADERAAGIQNIDEAAGFEFEKFYAQTLYGAAVERINREGLNLVSLRRIQLALGMGKDSLRELGNLHGCYAVLSVLYVSQGQYDRAIEAANHAIESAKETGHVDELPTLRLQLRKAEAAAMRSGK